MRRLPGLLLLLLPAALVAAPDVETEATDRAHQALAEGRPGEAAAQLRAALGKTSDEAARHRLRCLLGAAWLQDDEPARAEVVLADVPLDAPCGPRAAFLRADALLALGRAEEAAAIYDAVGGPRMGDDRDAEGAEAVARIAGRLLDDPDRGREHGLNVLARALDLRIGAERRRALARELADAAGARHDVACRALLDALRAEDTREDRLRAATVCGSDQAWPLLSTLGDDPEVLAARARHADAGGADVLRTRALPATRDELARTRANQWRLDALPLLEERDDPDALRRRAKLLSGAGREAEAVALLDEHRARFPADPQRNEVLSERAALVLALAQRAAAEARHAEALERYDDLVERHADHHETPRATWEAGVVARAAGDAEDARRRWTELLARWPDSEAAGAAIASLARQLAVDEGNPDAAFDLLRRLAERHHQAPGILTELQRRDVWIDGGPRVARDPVVQVGARNLDEVELELHRIDAEAFVRAGGTIAGLRDLDIGVVAPDRAWTVAVPDPKPVADVVLDVPVDVPGPGLYAVTAASDEEEAKALVLVSDLVLVARAVGPDLAVATFLEDGRPAPGTRVVAVTGGAVVDGRTDASGLWTTELPPSGPVTLLALRDGAPALLEVPRDAAHTYDVGHEVHVELERPVVRPGDTAGVRAVVRLDGEPVTGEWTVWLDRHGTALTSQRARSDAEGRLVLELRVPSVDASGSFQILGVPPGQATPLTLGSLQVEPERAAERTMTARIDGTGAIVEVREADGRPAVDVPIAWGEDRVARTDRAGRARVEGPAAGVPWTLHASIAGTPIAASAARQMAHRPSLALRVDQDRLRPGEPARVRLVGDRPARVEVARLIPHPGAAPEVLDPWVARVAPGPTGPITWRGAGPEPDPAVEDVARTLDVVATEEGATVDVGALEAGRWRIRAASIDGFAFSSTVELRVDAAATRLVGARDAALAEALTLGAEGGVALVTAEADRLLWASVSRGDRAARAEVTPEWGYEAVLAATTPSGDVHARRISVDPDLQVALTTEPRPDGTALVRAVVTDGAGRPVRAQVSLAGWDTALQVAAGAPPSLGTQAFVDPAPPVPQVGGLSREWRDADAGTPISGALRAEALRLAEREKAKQASSGLLSDNNLARALVGDLPLVVLGSAGALGASGYGRGGGGSFGGKAGGVVGGVVGGAVDAGLPGFRERALWHVAEADRDGVVTAVLDGPAARWQVRATAVAGRSVKTVERSVRTDARLWVAVHEPEPGFGGDRARPYASVVNGTDEALAGALVVGEDRVPFELDAGEVASLPVGEPRAPGPDVSPVVATAGRWTARASWRFPLAEGAPAADGPVATVHVGEGGRVPVRSLALAERDPVLRGRAALAALSAGPDPLLEAAVRDALDHLRLVDGRRDAPREASRLVFLAELAETGLVEVTKAEIEEAAARLPAPTSPEISAWIAFARARAKLPVDPDLLVILRDAELADADRARLQRARAWLGQGDPPEVDVAAAPPPLGSLDRPEWIRAVAARPGKVRGVATVRVDGRVDGTIDLATGGALRVLADGPIAVDGAPAVIERSAPPRTGDEPAALVRLPRGASGLPLRPRTTSNATACDPCRVGVGDALTWRGRDVLRAAAPGSFVVRLGELGDERVAAPITVEVTAEPGPGPLVPEVALLVAEERLAAGLDPALPTVVEPEHVRRAARIAFEHALRTGDDAEIAKRFRALATVQRDASVALEDVARAARALDAIGDPVAATRVWRAGLDAAFTSEAAALRRLEDQAGVLAAVKLVRDAALRYPDGPAVGEALYLLPAQLRAMAEDHLPSEVLVAGITAMDLRLQAAAWDREFLALQRGHDQAPAAGLRLSRSLLALGAPEPAAYWARTVAAADPDDALLDSLVYLEALARTESAEPGAERLLRRLVDEPFPDPRGVPGASRHQDEAQLVLGRLHEARGDLSRALEAYDAVADWLPEADRSRAALREERLELPPLVALGTADAARIDVVAQSVDEVQVRAYAIDLRTLFLRDGGLGQVRYLSVAGVSPAWSGQRRLDAGPFPAARVLDLPLTGSGAWLVQVEGDGPRASTLVVRSGLEVATTDVGGVRRITARRRGLPAQGLEVRALVASGTDVVATTTDVRGVAEVPAAAPVLVWDGEEVAFSDPTEAPSAQGASGATGFGSLLDGLDERLGTQQEADTESYRRRFDARQPAAMSLEAL